MDEDSGLQESIIETAKLDTAHAKACNSAAKKLRDLGLVKRVKSIPVKGTVFGVTSRRTYSPSLFSGYMLSHVISAVISLNSVQANPSEESFPVEITERQRVFALDNFEMYLRGRWITYSEQMRRVLSLIDHPCNLGLIDNGLFISQRNMPQTTDTEVLHFFNKVMEPSVRAWDVLARTESPPILVGINSFVRSKLTRAVSSGLAIESIDDDSLPYLHKTESENPWMGEGALIYSLLNKPGLRSVFYRLTKEHLGSLAPDSLGDSGGVVATYVRTSNAIFQIEIPYYQFKDDVTKYEEVVSSIVWLAEFQKHEVPMPLSYARVVCEDRNLRQSLDGLMTMIRRMR
ncbi:MAG: hypothetical protein ACFFER_00875 [Candidatus Thorarchaeota archaeon]